MKTKLFYAFKLKAFNSICASNHRRSVCEWKKKHFTLFVATKKKWTRWHLHEQINGQKKWQKCNYICWLRWIIVSGARNMDSFKKKIWTGKWKLIHTFVCSIFIIFTCEKNLAKWAKKKNLTRAEKNKYRETCKILISFF